MASRSRPLSPHLGIYKPQITLVLSILHRITGMGLAFGLVVFVFWLVALAGGSESYDIFIGWIHSLLGQIILFGLTAALFFHFCAGIRHMLWNIGIGFDIKECVKAARPFWSRRCC